MTLYLHHHVEEIILSAKSPSKLLYAQRIIKKWTHQLQGYLQELHLTKAPTAGKVPPSLQS